MFFVSLCHGQFGGGGGGGREGIGKRGRMGWDTFE